jgi:hypothetical protein
MSWAIFLTLALTIKLGVGLFTPLNNPIILYDMRTLNISFKSYKLPRFIPSVNYA